MNILLLEDDKALHKSITKIIQRLGHKVTGYYDAESFLEAFDCSFDLYILDINLPQGDGLDVLKILKENFADANVMMISAYDSIDYLESAYKLGCMDYLKKPFHLEELQYKINLFENKKEELLAQLPLKDQVNLTKKEKKFLTLLLKHKKQVVNYELIESHLYPESQMSMESLRSLVKRIRSKTTKDIIQNIKDEGYQILL